MSQCYGSVWYKHLYVLSLMLVFIIIYVTAFSFLANVCASISQICV